MDKIDNVYVINMAKSKDRLQKMSEQIPKLGRPFTRIDAVNGSLLNDQELDRLATPFCRRFCTNGMIGCFLSHKKCWQNMVQNGDRYALILEDDCELVDTFQQDLGDATDELQKYDPAWDFLYGGCFGPCHKSDEYTFGTYLHSLFLTKITDHTHLKNLKYTFVPESAVGTHCYVISQVCARKLLQIFDKASYHVDVELVRNSADLHMYATKKKIGMQFPTADTSTLTVYNFPSIPNYVIDNMPHDRDGISYSMFLQPAVLQIGYLPINPYFLLFVFLSICFALFMPTKYVPFFTYLLLFYMAIELLLNPSNLLVIGTWLAIYFIIQRLLRG